jgi:hypothetical protein
MGAIGSALSNAVYPQVTSINIKVHFSWQEKLIDGELKLIKKSGIYDC